MFPHLSPLDLAYPKERVGFILLLPKKVLSKFLLSRRGRRGWGKGKEGGGGGEGNPEPKGRGGLEMGTRKTGLPLWALLWPQKKLKNSLGTNEKTTHSLFCSTVPKC